MLRHTRAQIHTHIHMLAHVLGTLGLVSSLLSLCQENTEVTPDILATAKRHRALKAPDQSYGDWVMLLSGLIVPESELPAQSSFGRPVEVNKNLFAKPLPFCSDTTS